MAVCLLNRVLHKIAFIAPGGYCLRPRLHRLRGVKMGFNVWISQFVYIDELHPEAVTIKDNVTIGLRTSIFAHMYWGNRRLEGGCKEVVIEKNAFIGPHCLILPGVHVGEGAVIKGGSVLTRNVPAHVFWGSHEPTAIAKVTAPLTAKHSYEEFVRGLRPIRKANPTVNSKSENHR
jgi:acetyltransferase-like isoleucine patch superfamily enzyme